MEYFEFLSKIEDYLLLCCDNLLGIIGVKKNCYRNKYEICLFCDSDQRDGLIETFEELNSVISPEISDDYYIGLRGVPVKKTDYIYVIFFLVNLKFCKYNDD